MTIGIMKFLKDYLKDKNKYRPFKRFIDIFYNELLENKFITEDRQIVNGNEMMNEYKRITDLILINFLKKNSLEKFDVVLQKVYQNKAYFVEIGMIEAIEPSEKFNTVYLVKDVEAFQKEIQLLFIPTMSDFFNSHNLSYGYRRMINIIRENREYLIDKDIICQENRITRVFKQKELFNFLKKKSRGQNYQRSRIGTEFAGKISLTGLMRENFSLSVTESHWLRRKLQVELLELDLIEFTGTERRQVLVVKNEKKVSDFMKNFLESPKYRKLTPRQLIFNHLDKAKGRSFYTRFCQSEKIRDQFKGFKMLTKDGKKTYLIADRIAFIKSLESYKF
jgi:tRNA splicing endonuclease